MTLPDESQAPDEIQDQPQDDSTPEAPEAAVEATPEDKAATPEPEMFSEHFDPATLDEALRPAYKQMQGRFTQRMQELAEKRQLLAMLESDDPDEQVLGLHALGYDVDLGDEDDEDDGEYEYADEPEGDELAALRQEVSDLREWREGLTQAEQQEQFETAVNEFLDESWAELKKDTGRDDFTEKEELLLEQIAAANLDDDGLPDLKAAYDLLYSDVLPDVRKRWVKSKDAPRVSRAGSSATQVPDLDTEKGRHEYMAERAAQIMAAEKGHTGT